MNDTNTATIDKYRNNFLREVEDNVEEGQWHQEEECAHTRATGCKRIG